MKKLLRVPLLGGALMFSTLISSVPAAYANHAWENYHWGRTTTGEFTLSIGDNTTTLDWKSILTAAITDWKDLVGNDVSTTGAVITPRWGEREVIPELITGNAGTTCSLVPGTAQVCNAKYGSNGWLGLATVTYIVNTGHITEATAMVNDTYFSKGRYNNPNQKRHVMCQEVAHTFGLGHQSEDGTSLYTCMDYFSNTGRNATNSRSTIPNYHDYEQLSTIYNSHTDTSSTVATTASALETQADANTPDNDNQRLWGRLLSQSQNGRSSVYEQTLDSGSKIVRHVYWTEETAAKCPACDHRFHDKE